MRFWFEFFASRSFGLDFKVANLVMRDALRNYLTVDRLILLDLLESDNLTAFQRAKIKGVVSDVESLMNNK